LDSSDGASKFSILILLSGEFIKVVVIAFIKEVPAKFGLSEKNHEKSHFMLIFGELLVCRLQTKRLIQPFGPIGKNGN